MRPVRLRRGGWIAATIVVGTLSCAGGASPDAESVTPGGELSATPAQEQGGASSTPGGTTDAPATGTPTADANGVVGAKVKLVGNYLALAANALWVGRPAAEGSFSPTIGGAGLAQFRYRNGMLETDGACLGTATGGPGPAQLVACSGNQAFSWAMNANYLSFGKSSLPEYNQAGGMHPFALVWQNCVPLRPENGNCRLAILAWKPGRQETIAATDDATDRDRFALTPMDANTHLPATGAFLSVDASPTDCLTDDGRALLLAPCSLQISGQQWQFGDRESTYLPGAWASPRSDLKGCISLADSNGPLLTRARCEAPAKTWWSWSRGSLTASVAGNSNQQAETQFSLTTDAGPPRTLRSVMRPAGALPTSSTWTWGPLELKDER